MVSTEDVRAAYRLILGREPEDEEVLMRHAQNAGSLQDLRTAFLSSPEFHIVSPEHSALRPLDWPPIEVEVNTSSSNLSAMMRHVEANWRVLGASDPHWSVITHEAFRASNIAQTEKLFYESGKGYTDVLRRTAERCGVDLSGFGRCLELGCGVGRLTIWLADLFERVVAADISPAHLALARQALDSYQRTNVDLVHLDSFSALEAVPEFDVFISVIVLQHNPPPLIAALLKTVLEMLRPGGIAYFQVPTYLVDYRFRINEYLQNTSPIGGIEMHLIPQSWLFEILEQSGCRLLECREDYWTGIYEMISNSIFAKKREGAHFKGAVFPGRSEY
jgi:SAM-dependent methyltransferase